MVFEVTKEDICRLNDGALRELVGRLCRAEVAACGLVDAAVRYGGDQNAPDGGIDVEVDVDRCLAGGYLAKGHTVFQVKKPSMPPSSIKKEMCPQGALRPLFTSLAQEKGNYIIVSSGDDLTASTREKRITAMSSALGLLANYVHIDYFDRSTLVAWCNQYPTVVCWVKHFFGLEPIGWKPYGDWTESHVNTSYLLDDTARFYTPDIDSPLNPLECIAQIRSILHGGGNSIRLIGLSGVGKTRFAQALFEEDIGQRPLSPDKVLYLNSQDEAKIPPVEMVERLLRAKEQAVVVVDNCTANEHHVLTEKCTRPDSTVSLLTIEYDVQEDEPEDSSVYRMLPSSDDCLCQLLEQRFPGWPTESYRRIAKLAGGNARIAIVLAKAAPQNRDLSELKDKELFDRLFWQNGQHDKELELAAKVCSLVYSFSVGIQEPDQPVSELNCLAELAGLSQDVLYRNIAMLMQKQLVQARGDWRAVLPHALANRLATAALEEIPMQRLLSHMEQSTQHMLRSFSKRLSYLHDSPSAQEIFRYWLTVPPMCEPNKWGMVCSYRLEDSAPVIPEEVLTYLESICENGKHPERLKECFSETLLCQILIQLAYEPKWFVRSLMLIAMIPKQPYGEAPGIELFQIIRSGTKAPLEIRLSVIRLLLNDSSKNKRRLGIEYFGASMRAICRPNYNGPLMYEFGARQRDDGWSPHTHEEIVDWFNKVIDFAQAILPALPREEKYALSEEMAKNFRDLWHCKCQEVVEYCCNSMACNNGSWWPGWLGLGEIRKSDIEKMPSEERERLLKLIELTRPKEIVEQAVCFMSTGSWKLKCYFPTEPGKYENPTLISEIRRLGREVSKKDDDLVAVLDALNKAESNAYYFGEELAECELEPGAMWPILAKHIARRSISNILLGYLHVHHKKDPIWTSTRLREAENDETIRPIINLWTNLDGSKTLLDHTVELLHSKKLHLSDLDDLPYSFVLANVDESDVIEFLRKLQRMDGGQKAAVDLLSKYCCIISSRTDGKKFTLTLQAYIRSLFIAFIKEHSAVPGHSYEFKMAIIRSFGVGVPIDEVLSFFCALPAFLKKWDRSYVGDEFISEAVAPIAYIYTEIFLDSVFEMDDNNSKRMLLDDGYSNVSILDQLDQDRTICWANTPEKNAFLAKYCSPFDPGNDNWSALATRLLHTEDGATVLKVLTEHFRPRSWSNSLYEILEKRLKLFQQLEHDAILGEAAHEVLPDLEDITKSVKKWEEKYNNRRAYQQFEF